MYKCEGSDLNKKFVISSSKGFQPFTVTIRIDSEEEAKEWMLRFSLYLTSLKKAYAMPEVLNLDFNSGKSYIKGITHLRKSFLLAINNMGIRMYKNSCRGPAPQLMCENIDFYQF